MVTQVYEKIYKIELPIPFPLKTTNVYFVDDSPKTLVDSGIKTEPSFEALKKGLKEIGVRLDSIERILITHGHIDHYGQAKKISSLTGAPIYLHAKEYGKVRSVIHSFGLLRSVLLRNGVPQSLVAEAVHFIESAQTMADSLDEAFFLEEGTLIPFSSMTWRSLHCPGHSPGMICFHWPEKKILFTGDHLLKTITPNPVIHVSEFKFPLRYPSLREYLSSLEKVKHLGVTHLLPGHGEEVQDPKELIEKILAHHQGRMRRVEDFLTGGEKTPFEIALKLFPGVPAFEIFLGISETVGHLDILREQGKVRVTEKEGIDYYTLEP